ncbi:COP9 signalosome complex subunit 5 [Wickerhamomyces ciferrii]|uniref:COP9 signalosome complex subunit 5 n=1 Tax=Wickerhamomyces ciferrii (strain ATCC 14091 / BCRC 22168 / CBS 111 / JCM 3599 / NBRC 0793 / NRRL Y-1031 F-60-10) TaxID=1206466 RepID=K0KU30_WICCF|nr:COP9 signalosome complex subunit 5 [Wickerhamomyces ciferrii]CCH44733.1 COP9 signalosome complex subunit 5 [Wickerhamomyces ciferrii]
MSGIGIENLNAKRNAFFLQSFSKPKTDGGESEKQHGHNHTQPLDTVEADLNTILSQSSSERSETFYNDTYIQEVNAELSETKPWKKDPNYFQHVYVSPLALLKMTIHARSGGSIEIMGMLTGRIVKNGIVVMDVYPLPVEGTETRVNAQAEGYEFMVQYLDSLKKTGRYENIVGWYHSHPGYGCWLSGIDVATQSLNQQFQDPYLAIVVDPERTIANGKVEIGAFRTYTDDYVKNNTMTTATPSKSLGTSPFVKRSQSIKKNGQQNVKDIPSEKIQDFGLHSSRYYSLSIEIFRSSVENQILKNLWNKFWISNLLSNSEDVKKEDVIDFDRFLNEKFDTYSRKINSLKIDPNNSAPNSKGKSKPATSFQEKIQSAISGNIPGGLDQILNKQRLEALLTSKYLGRAKGKSNVRDSDDSDSEMNDDSDIDVRNLQDDLEDDNASKLSGKSDSDTSAFKFLRDSRKSLTGLSVASPTQPNLMKLSNHPSNTAVDANSKPESSEDFKIRSAAAAASRDLVTLKLQEILFLNE